jgi:hypothetical protein
MVEEMALEGMRAAQDDNEAEAVKQFRTFLKENPEKAVDILQERL